MTEKTFIVLFVCVTIICIVSILADCYKTALKTKDEKKIVELKGFEAQEKPPHSGSSVMRRSGVEVGSKEWMEDK